MWALVQELEAENVFARELTTNGTAWHSSCLDPVLPELLAGTIQSPTAWIVGKQADWSSTKQICVKSLLLESPKCLLSTEFLDQHLQGSSMQAECGLG